MRKQYTAPEAEEWAFTFSEKFDLMPAPRLAHGGRRCYRDTRYFINRDTLTFLIKQEMYRQKTMRVKGPVILIITVYLSHNRKADIDNYAKTIMDAMSKAGTWDDDRQVECLTMLLCRGEVFGRVDIEAKGGKMIAPLTLPP